MSDPGAIRIDLRKVLEDKNPRLSKLVPDFIINWLKRVVHQEELNEFLSENGHLRDVELVRAGISFLGVKYKVHNQELIPERGRYIFVSNHPLGGLDGIVFMDELSRHFDEIRFPANDLLLNIKGMSGIFLPVNKHGAQSRETAVKIEEAYASDVQILYFPAGLCSRKKKGRIIDLEWQKNFVNKAVKHQRDIVPAYFSGRNSNFFYNLANLRKFLGIKANLEMVYLPDEMFRQRDRELHLVFGKPIPWQTFDRSRKPGEWAKWIKDKTYELESYIKDKE